jgi:tetratricopeptide (TPR) repeat protein
MAHSNLGFAYLQQGEFTQAIAACRRAVELAPDLLQAHNNLAAAYLQTNDQEASIAASLRALEINEHFVPAHFNLAVAYHSQGDLEKAREHYKRARDLGCPADEQMENI